VTADMSLWEAWYSQDGITVFFGTSHENQDVIMVSFIVQGPPSLVTEACPAPHSVPQLLCLLQHPRPQTLHAQSTRHAWCASPYLHRLQQP
jgi:hypothetical protein